MNPLLCTFLFALGQAPAAENLNFRHGSLRGWEGEGFYLTAGSPNGPATASFGVCSSDAGNPSKKGMLRYVLTVPPGTGILEFRAFAVTAPGIDSDSRLDVVLANESNQLLPKKVRGGAGSWVAATKLLSRWQGKPRDYGWDVSSQVGQTLQIVLIDNDDRANHHVYAAGFRFVASQQFQDNDFARFMTELERKNGLSSMARFDSKRFTSLSNASAKFTVERLRNCEIFCDQFLNHFQRRGFKVYPPPHRLMVAAFDSPEGFEAYLGQKMPSSIVGIYHILTNRLVLYDLNENRSLVAHKNKVLRNGAKIADAVERGRFVNTVERETNDYAKDANLSTTMHEAAHQISFNCGLLNREGDGPCWLVEGMATYCESTDQGDWTALGGPNPLRLADLRRARGQLMPIEVLLRDDQWRGTPHVLLGYAQSWALFRMLMHERPQQLRQYLATLYQRKTPDYRLADFRQAFGNDLAAMDRRHQNYVRDLLKDFTPPKSN